MVICVNKYKFVVTNEQFHFFNVMSVALQLFHQFVKEIYFEKDLQRVKNNH